MRHITFDTVDNPSIALLIKPSAFISYSLETHYVMPMCAKGLSKQDIIAFDLAYDQTNKASAKTIKAYSKELLTGLKELGVKTLLVADSAYYKHLSGQSKAEANIGYVHKCVIPGFEDMSVIMSVNYQQMIYNPDLQEKLTRSLDTVVQHTQGTFLPPGASIIHSAYYPKTVEDIETALGKLHQYPVLFCDIEAFSLDFRKAGIGSIAFAWDKHNGIAFPVDYHELPLATTLQRLKNNGTNTYGVIRYSFAHREMLRKFFMAYKGKVAWHNACYDVKILIHELFMGSLGHTEGLLKGLDIFTENLEDTKIISYLATNSTAGNKLSLKEQAQEFAGNWAEDNIKDITLIPLPDLLQYNLVDALSTAYVYEKNTPIMVADNQEAIYRNIMLPSIKTIIQMELTGMPIKAKKLKELQEYLNKKANNALAAINNLHIIKTLNFLLQEEALESANAKLKVKQHTIEKFQNLMFNPNSNKQLQTLLYTQMALPVLDKTETGAPATGAETISKLIAHAKNPDYVEALNLIIEYSKAEKIRNTFLPAFETSSHISRHDRLLFGSFNLGGTVSGRLSSSNPKHNWALSK